MPHQPGHPDPREQLRRLAALRREARVARNARRSSLFGAPTDLPIPSSADVLPTLAATIGQTPTEDDIGRSLARSPTIRQANVDPDFGPIDRLIDFVRSGLSGAAQGGTEMLGAASRVPTRISERFGGPELPSITPERQEAATAAIAEHFGGQPESVAGVAGAIGGRIAPLLGPYAAASAAGGPGVAGRLAGPAILDAIIGSDPQYSTLKAGGELLGSETLERFGADPVLGALSEAAIGTAIGLPFEMGRVSKSGLSAGRKAAAAPTRRALPPGHIAAGPVSDAPLALPTGRPGVAVDRPVATGVTAPPPIGTPAGPVPGRRQLPPGRGAEPFALGPQPPTPAAAPVPPRALLEPPAPGLTSMGPENLAVHDPRISRVDPNRIQLPGMVDDIELPGMVDDIELPDLPRGADDFVIPEMGLPPGQTLPGRRTEIPARAASLEGRTPLDPDFQSLIDKRTAERAADIPEAELKNKQGFGADPNRPPLDPVARALHDAEIARNAPVARPTEGSIQLTATEGTSPAVRQSIDRLSKGEQVELDRLFDTISVGKPGQVIDDLKANDIVMGLRDLDRRERSMRNMLRDLPENDISREFVENELNRAASDRSMLEQLSKTIGRSGRSKLNFSSGTRGTVSDTVMQALARAGVGGVIGGVLGGEEGAIIGAAGVAVGPAALRKASAIVAPSYRNLTEAGMIQSLKESVRRNFYPQGNFPEAAFDRLVRRNSGVGSELNEARYALRDLQKALRQEYGIPFFKQPSKETLGLIDQALKGEIPITDLPNSIQNHVRRLRLHVDKLSRRMVKEGVVEGKTAATVTNHLGTYLTRTYRRFSDPKWASKVPADVQNRAKSFIRSAFPDLTEDEIHRKIKALLYYDKDASPIAFMTDKKVSKDLSILKMRGNLVNRRVTMPDGKVRTVKVREDIPAEIRALWGEELDPRISYMNSIGKMAQLIETHKFLEDVRVEGLREGWLHLTDVAKDRHFAPIAPKGSETLKPLAGLYTTPAIARAFRELGEIPSHSMFWRHYMKANGAVKYGKTVLSLMTHVRNTVGNVGFAVANGHIDPRAMRNAISAVADNLGLHLKEVPTVKVKGPGGGVITKRARDYYDELFRLGVVDESVRAGELTALMRDAFAEIDTPHSWMGRQVFNFKEGITNLYRAEDDLWKIFAYEHELSRYRAALGSDTPDAVIKQIAATNVRNTYPTYSLVPRALRALRTFPIVGSFVSFPWEVLRTGKRTIGLAAKEIADPRLRKIGMQRAAGILAASTGVGAMAIASRALVGTDDEEEEAMRRFYRPWEENSSIVHLSSVEDGRAKYVDVSYTDPHNYLRKPVIAMLRGEDWEEKLVEAAFELGSSFFDEEIAAGALLDIARNKKKDGGPVYNAQEPDWLIKQSEKLAHFWSTVRPGVADFASRLQEGFSNDIPIYGQNIDPTTEIASQLTGIRVNDFDAREALGFKMRAMSRNMREATRILTSAMNDGKKGEELQDAMRRSDEARFSLFQEAVKDVNAMRKLLVPEADIIKTLQASGVGSGLTGQILTNTYVPADVRDILRNQAEGIKLRGGDPRPVLDETVEAMKEFRSGPPRDAGTGFEQQTRARLVALENQLREATPGSAKAKFLQGQIRRLRERIRSLDRTERR